MKLLIINSVCGIGSTGQIGVAIADDYERRGWEVKFAYGREGCVPESCRKWAVRIGSSLSVRLHGVLTRLFDWHADRICSWWATRKFLKWVEEWKPDMLWLHNLHGYYINYELLFKWIKKHPEMEVKWTLHDCWAFTGHCSHFLLTDCDRWKAGCWGCPEKGEYPASKFLSAAKANWERKKKAFCGVKKMTLITPSNWLADNRYVHFQADAKQFQGANGFEWQDDDSWCGECVGPPEGTSRLSVSSPPSRCQK